MEWRKIKEFPEYQISDDGLVISFRIPADGRTSHRFGHVTNGTEHPSGYAAVMLRKQGATKTYRRTIHRLVALAFLPNPHGFSDVAHNDGDPRNNHVSNLRWCTHRDNQMDMRRHGTMQDGARCITAKITESQAKEIRRRAQKRGQGVVLAREFGLSKAQISRIKNASRWKYL